MTSKPGDVVRADGSILTADLRPALLGRIVVTREQGECAKWFGWKVDKEWGEGDLVVVERRTMPTGMQVARTLLRVWPKKGRRVAILARPFEGRMRKPNHIERARAALGGIGGLDLCAVMLTGLPKDEALRDILIDAGPNTLDLGEIVP